MFSFCHIYMNNTIRIFHILETSNFTDVHLCFMGVLINPFYIILINLQLAAIFHVKISSCVLVTNASFWFLMIIYFVLLHLCS